MALLLGTAFDAVRIKASDNYASQAPLETKLAIGKMKKKLKDWTFLRRQLNEIKVHKNLFRAIIFLQHFVEWPSQLLVSLSRCNAQLKLRNTLFHNHFDACYLNYEVSTYFLRFGVWSVIQMVQTSVQFFKASLCFLSPFILFASSFVSISVRLWSSGVIRESRVGVRDILKRSTSHPLIDRW